MIARRQSKRILEALDDTPVVLIHGPRQCGKSTVAEEIARSRFGGRMVTLDDPLTMHLARSDPKGFFAAYPPPILVDEIQRAPNLFQTIKLLVDRKRDPGQFLLTGSANVLSLPRLSDSLAGRMEIIDLLPFSVGERWDRADGFVDAVFDGTIPTSQALDLPDAMLRGGFPEPSLRPTANRRADWFANYIRTLLERDVKDLAQIEAIGQMPQLLRILASRVGQPLNVSAVAADTGIPATSVKRYVSLLETLFLIHTVPAWSLDRPSALAKTPKAFLTDTGLLGYLLNLDAKTLSEDPVRFPLALENFVAMELIKQASFGCRRPTVMHLRSTRRHSVDFVLEDRGGDIVGVDVRTSATLRATDTEGLTYLHELAGRRFTRGIVLYLGSEVVPLGDRLLGIPMGSLSG